MKETQPIPDSLTALRRVARVAWRRSRETGTPYIVWKDGKIVDLNARPRRPAKR